MKLPKEILDKLEIGKEYIISGYYENGKPVKHWVYYKKEEIEK